MNVLKWLIIFLAFTEAGWMAFDGMRALIVGDYVTPSTGEHAGQLGPWQYVVSAIGIAPRSTLMKLIFTIYGFAWLVIIVAFARGVSWARTAMLLAAVGSLWYLPVGTCTSVLVIVLMLVRMRMN